jgi:hypothetical protein
MVKYSPINEKAILDDYQISGAMMGKTVNDNSSKKDSVEPNVLGKYASYNYIWTLSALSREELQDPRNVGKRIHDVIAKSSGIGLDGAFRNFNEDINSLYKGNADAATTITKEQGEKIKSQAKNADKILRRGHDIFFEKVTMTAVHRPNEQRKMMNFTKLDIEMHEPYGVTLFEKLRAAAFNNNFRDHIDAPYLLTLEFRGYDNLGNPIGNVITTRYLPIKITNAEMEIDAGGTRYSLVAVPWTEFAMTDRFLFTRGQSSVVGDAAAKVGIGTKTAFTLSGALALLADGINAQQKIEIERRLRRLEDQYFIEVEDGINQSAAGSSNWNLAGAGGNFKINVRPNVSIAKLITDLVQQADGYRNITEIVKKYWKDLETYSTSSDGGYDKEPPDPYVPWFKIKTTIVMGEQFDNITKQHQKIIIYRVIPYKVHVMNFTVPGLSASGLWGKSVRKAYKYIYTGENTEILDLKINYKYGYFQARLYDGSRSDAVGKIPVKDLSLQQLYDRYGGTQSQPESLLPLRSYPSTQKSEDGATTDGASRTQVDEFYDYLTNPRGDMVNVQMTIMGDPAFIGQDFALPIKTTEKPENTGALKVTEQSEFKGRQWDENKGCFNYDEAEAFVTLDFKFPTDIDERKGVMDFQSLENVQFNGLYKVVQVESIFDRGKFTQVLDLVRYNNQGKEMSPVVSLKQIESNAEAERAPIDVVSPDDLGTIFDGTVRNR